MGSIKPHAVCVPFPAQGHVNPMMQLAKLLHSRGLHITFVNSEFNHRRLVRSGGEDAVKGLPDFQFETIPDGLPPSDLDATQPIPVLLDSTRRTCLTPFMELLSKLNSSSELPPVTCIVCDAAIDFGTKAAKAIGVPYVQLWTASTVSFLGYLQYTELEKRGIVPFKDEHFVSDGTLDMPIDWIPGMPNMRLKDIPTFIRTTDPNDAMWNFGKVIPHESLEYSSIIFNTFDEFEREVLQVLANRTPKLYAIGPLTLLSRNINIPELQYDSLNSSLWKEDTSCMEWLNTMEPNSVVYVNYGSITVMSDHHLKEFAWGLANSKYPFLWVVRPDVVMGESAILPKEFMEEIKGRGFVTSWCPQQQVLSHPAIGVFLTHCGWNSLLEAVCQGVPLICWPFFGDQQTNCRYACTTWGNALEINHDVKREDVEALVTEMMEGDHGKRIRQKALEWKKIVKASVGSSVTNFDRMIKDITIENQN